MENKTSEQAYEEYQKLKVVEERLERDNKGRNLLNSPKSEPTFSIRLYKEVEGNLLTMTSKILVYSNLPFMDWRDRELSIEDFFKKFEEYVKLPVFNRFIKLNRRQENELSTWGLPKFRENMINIKDIDISFGEECKNELDKVEIIGFTNRIITILARQRNATESESKDFTRYFFLCEKIEDLNRQVKSSSYGYSYREEKTLKMTITDEEHDKKLKLVEDELKALKNKYDFLKTPTIRYKKEEECGEYEEEDYDEEMEY